MHEFEELPRLTVTEKINKMNDSPSDKVWQFNDSEKVLHIDDCKTIKTAKRSLPSQDWYQRKNSNNSLDFAEKIMNEILDKTLQNVKSRTCNICKTTLSSNYYLKEHIENHFMPTQVECNVCLKMLSQNSLGNHMKQHDGLKIEDKSGNFFIINKNEETNDIEEKKFSCKVCHKKFKLKKH